jgi:hypothetical protein
VFGCKKSLGKTAPDVLSNFARIAAVGVRFLRD